MLIQYCVLALSWFQFFYGIIRTMSHIDISMFPRKKSILSRLWTVLDIPVVFEFGCLVIGAAFIYQQPGIASLRILRPFRLLWYTRLYSSDNCKEPR